MMYKVICTGRKSHQNLWYEVWFYEDPSQIPAWQVERLLPIASTWGYTYDVIKVEE